MLNLENYLSAGQTVISNLLLKNYHRIGLQSEEFLFVLQLHMAQLEGDTFPDLQMIAMDMGIKQDQIFSNTGSSRNKWIYQDRNDDCQR